ncbi:MAG: SURF1 family protein [Nitrosospira sp.]|nr:SURF1 family protein [Nitrosospira sp.]
MVQLGNWQLSRAQEKEWRQEQLDRLSNEPAIVLPALPVILEDFQYRQVEVRGEYIPEHTIYLDNKIHRGVAGYHIVTPLRIGTSTMHVLVNRGWAPADSDRSKLPQVPVPAGQVVVSGIATTAVQKTLELSKEIVSGQVWANLDPDRYQSITGIALQPVMILQTDDVKDGLVRQWARPDSGSAKNWGYAVQWFSMALAVLIIYLVLSGKRDRSKKE